MKWLQFLTPVKSIDFNETQEMIATAAADALTILDVRQPNEYEQNHIPGAQLIPLPELSDRLKEIDPEKPVLVYCAIGGRSRVAAQMLSGKGFKQVYNVAGGIKAWQAKIAVGTQDLGMDLFSGKESAEDILKVAYSLEQGLEHFYLSMEGKSENSRVKDLFLKLSEIEVKHQLSILSVYDTLFPGKISRADFETMVETKALEGGMTTDQYLELFSPDLDSETEVISLAMSIEAQALDLYQRVGARLSQEEPRKVVLGIANEEKAHLASLGKLMAAL